MQWLDLDQAVDHCTRGLGIWEFASNDEGAQPDVVMACCGDVPTLETLAAVDLLRRHLPDLLVRVVNVVDLMRLEPESEHPHGLPDAEFDTIFTADRPVIFAYHGYPWLIHRLTYRRTNHHSFHVRGDKEEGTTTTPFDMVMMNDLDRFHLVMDVLDRVPGLGERTAALRQRMVDARLDARRYRREHGEDPPEVADWRWSPGRARLRRRPAPTCPPGPPGPIPPGVGPRMRGKAADRPAEALHHPRNGLQRGPAARSPPFAARRSRTRSGGRLSPAGRPPPPTGWARSPRRASRRGAPGRGSARVHPELEGHVVVPRRDLVRPRGPTSMFPPMPAACADPPSPVRAEGHGPGAPEPGRGTPGRAHVACPVTGLVSAYAAAAFWRGNCSSSVTFRRCQKPRIVKISMTPASTKQAMAAILAISPNTEKA